MTMVGRLSLLALATLIVGCGTAAQNASKPEYYTVGGVVLGLDGDGLELRNNNSDTLVVIKPTNPGSDVSTPFSFPVSLLNGSEYNVTVSKPPVKHAQDCKETKNTGKIDNANVDTIEITCTSLTYAVTGKVLGLVGRGLVIRNQWTDDLNATGAQELAIDPDANISGAEVAFNLPAIPGLTQYDIAVAQHPNAGKHQVCDVRHDDVNPGRGTVNGANVAGVIIDCRSVSVAVGGAVSYLNANNRSLKLQLSYGDAAGEKETLTVNSFGDFNFTHPVDEGASYTVVIAQQPIASTLVQQQTCWIEGGEGVRVAGDGSGALTVKCGFMLGGVVSGLNGELTISNSNANELKIVSNSNFKFHTPVVAGSGVEIQFDKQPKNQKCATVRGSAPQTMTDRNYQSLAIVCGHSIGGLLRGLLDGESVVLQNNGQDDLVLTKNGRFEFYKPITPGDPYDVSIIGQPTDQSCFLTYNKSTIRSYNVDNVNLLCGESKRSVGVARKFASLNQARTGHTLNYRSLDNSGVYTDSGTFFAVGGVHSGNYLASTEYYDPQLFRWVSVGDLNVARGYHTTTDTSVGREFIVIGGVGSVNGGKEYLSSIERFNISDSVPSWKLDTVTLTTPRSNHVTVRLSEQELLVIGGVNSLGVVGSAERISLFPNTQVVNVSNLNVPRKGFSATLLKDGKVLVVGGMDRVSNLLNSAEIYDPATNSWQLIKIQGVNPLYRVSHSASLLKNGNVLIVGGVTNGGATDSVQIFDVATSSWVDTTSLPYPQYGHKSSYYSDNQVIVVGGVILNSASTVTRIYNIDTKLWSEGPSLGEARSNPSVLVTNTGQIAVVGGSKLVNSEEGSTNSEFIERKSDVWRILGGQLNAARAGHSTILVTRSEGDRGKILAIGGHNFSGTLKSVEIYDPSTEKWSSCADMLLAVDYPSAIELKNGNILVLNSGADAQLYSPALDKWSMAGRKNFLGYGRVSILQDGTVLWVSNSESAEVERYVPDLDKWEIRTRPKLPHIGSSMILLQSGDAMLVSGDTANSGGSLTKNAEAYNLEGDKWVDIAPMNYARYGSSLTMLPDGKILAAGGTNSTLSSTNLDHPIEIYDPNVDKWTVSGSGIMDYWSYYHEVRLLPNGKVTFFKGWLSIFIQATSYLFTNTGEALSWGAWMWQGRTGTNAVMTYDGEMFVSGGQVAYYYPGSKTYYYGTSEAYH